MKEAIVSAGPKVEIIESPIPKPAANQVLIKVVVSGSNPKDFKRPEVFGPHNPGDDIAGIVEAVGDNVWEFKPGDRVAAFHELMTPHGSFAEYAIAWAHTTFHLPGNVSFEEAATIPLAAMTSAYALYFILRLPPPWRPTTTPTPLIINGGATAVGAYCIKLAQRSNIHPIIAVAGRGQEFVESLISRDKGDTIVDYRKGDLTDGLKAALTGLGISQSEAKYAVECVGDEKGYQSLYPVLATSGARMAVVNPRQAYADVPKSIELTKITVPNVHEDDKPDSEQGKAGVTTASKDFGYVYYRLFARGLADGWFTPHPHQVVEGGLGGVEKALGDLKAGRASGVKFVFRIGETEGVERG